jgi:hypothetical protein
MPDIREVIEAIRLAKATLWPALQKSLRDFLERLSELVEEYRKFQLRSHYFPWQDIRRVVEKIRVAFLRQFQALQELQIFSKGSLALFGVSFQAVLPSP